MNYFANNIQALRKQKGLSQKEMAENLGFPRTTWSSYEQGVSVPGLDELIRVAEFFGITMDSLISRDLSIIAEKLVNAHPNDQKGGQQKEGKSTPFRTPNSTPNHLKEPELAYALGMPKVVTIDSEGRDNVAFIPAKARAGYLAGYGDPEFVQKLPSFRLPGLNHGTFRAFEIEGHSMVPTFHESDWLIGRYVESFAEIRNNRVHIVLTKRDGIVVKRAINRVSVEGKLILNSDNQRHAGEYPPIVVDPEEVLEIWYAVMYFSRQMREPGEIFNRVIDLESEVTLIKEKLKNLPG